MGLRHRLDMSSTEVGGDSGTSDVDFCTCHNRKIISFQISYQSVKPSMVPTRLRTEEGKFSSSQEPERNHPDGRRARWLRRMWVPVSDVCFCVIEGSMQRWCHTQGTLERINLYYCRQPLLELPLVLQEARPEVVAGRVDDWLQVMVHGHQLRQRTADGLWLRRERLPQHHLQALRENTRVEHRG